MKPKLPVCGSQANILFLQMEKPAREPTKLKLPTWQRVWAEGRQQGAQRAQRWGVGLVEVGQLHEVVGHGILGDEGFEARLPPEVAPAELLPQGQGRPAVADAHRCLLSHARWSQGQPWEGDVQAGRKTVCKWLCVV